MPNVELISFHRAVCAALEQVSAPARAVAAAADRITAPMRAVRAACRVELPSPPDFSELLK